MRLRRNISIRVVLWWRVADYSLCCPRTGRGHATVLNSRNLGDCRWPLFLRKWPWTGCCWYNVQKQEAQRDSSSLLGLFAFFNCKRPGSMHRYITLAQVSTHSQASSPMFCSEEGRSGQSITCLKQRLENCLFPVRTCSEWRWRCWGKSITVSALCGCRNVLAVSRANDAARTKMIPENDCEDKLAFVGLWYVWFLYAARLWFVSLTKMFSLRPSLKMLHEIFLDHFY